MTAASRPSTLALCLLNGLAIPMPWTSWLSVNGRSGGVPAAAAVDIADCGVPTVGDSVLAT